MSDIFLDDQDFFSLLADSSIDAMIAIDMSGIITAWNNAATGTYNISAGEAIGKPLTTILPELVTDAEAKRGYDLAISGFKSFIPADSRIAYRSHSETHYLPLFARNNKQAGIMQLVHDVAHRIKAERKLEYLNDRLNEKNDELERALNEMASFTQISSNQIKLPIRNLYTDMEFLIKAEAKNLTDKGKATFRRMQSALNKMNLLMDDMLQLSQISVIKPSDKIDLKAITATVSEKLQEKLLDKNAVLETGELCTVTGDRTLLEKLFYQLIDNAIKFNESPSPLIKISCAETDRTAPEGNQTRKYSGVCIEDNGIGIDPGNIDQAFVLFEKVHESNYRGSGLGLTLANKIMHIHNGFIVIESIPGKGTCCNCYFPV